MVRMCKFIKSVSVGAVRSEKIAYKINYDQAVLNLGAPACVQDQLKVSKV